MLWFLLLTACTTPPDDPLPRWEVNPLEYLGQDPSSIPGAVRAEDGLVLEFEEEGHRPKFLYLYGKEEVWQVEAAFYNGCPNGVQQHIQDTWRGESGILSKEPDVELVWKVETYAAHMYVSRSTGKCTFGFRRRI
jgi:hypothetical protein